MAYYKHIYFEAKKPRTRDAVFQAVEDIGKPGVRSSKEVGALAIAQFLDWLDGKTKDHYGRTIKFTSKIWSGRMLILKRLAKKYGGIRHVNFVLKLKHEVEAKKISKKKARQLAIKYAKKHKLPITKFRI